MSRISGTPIRLTDHGRTTVRQPIRPTVVAHGEAAAGESLPHRRVRDASNGIGPERACGPVRRGSGQSPGCAIV